MKFLILILKAKIVILIQFIIFLTRRKSQHIRNYVISSIVKYYRFFYKMYRLDCIRFSCHPLWYIHVITWIFSHFYPRCWFLVLVRILYFINYRFYRALETYSLDRGNFTDARIGDGIRNIFSKQNPSSINILRLVIKWNKIIYEKNITPFNLWI